MPSRRSLLSYVPSAVTAGLLAPDPAAAQRENLEFAGIDGWLNTPGPLTIAGLHGKVVMVEFCTYTCINWLRTLPYVNRWHATYGPQGLQIIGVHTPEFRFERTRSYVETALRELDVSHPIALDSQYQTWNAWSNRAWPAFYLLDRNGELRLLREGEGNSREIEAAIRSLLGVAHAGASEPVAEDADLSRIGTPEIYFGALHPTPQDRTQSPRVGEATYTFASARGPRLNEYQLDGTWLREGEALVLHSARGRVRVRFSAAKLHLVAGAASQSTSVRINVDGSTDRTIPIGMPKLYTLLDGDRYGEHMLELECAEPGLSLFSATFG